MFGLAVRTAAGSAGCRAALGRRAYARAGEEVRSMAGAASSASANGARTPTVEAVAEQGSRAVPPVTPAAVPIKAFRPGYVDTIRLMTRLQDGSFNKDQAETISHIVEHHVRVRLHQFDEATVSAASFATARLLYDADLRATRNELKNAGRLSFQKSRTHMQGIERDIIRLKQQHQSAITAEQEAIQRMLFDHKMMISKAKKKLERLAYETDYRLHEYVSDLKTDVEQGKMSIWKNSTLYSVIAVCLLVLFLIFVHDDVVPAEVILTGE